MGYHRIQEKYLKKEESYQLYQLLLRGQQIKYLLDLVTWKPLVILMGAFPCNGNGSHRICLSGWKVKSEGSQSR